VRWDYGTDGVTPFSNVQFQVSIADGYGFTGAGGVGGPQVELLLDPVLTRRAGPLSTTTSDFVQARRAGSIVVTVPDFVVAKRAGSVQILVPDLAQARRAGPFQVLIPDFVQARRAGPVAGTVPDFVAQKRAGPLSTFKAQIPVRGEKVVAGKVRGTELSGGVVAGEFTTPS
jgi:hypothetical protein